MTPHSAAPVQAAAGKHRPMTALTATIGARRLYRVHRLLQVLSGGRASLHVYLFCAQPVGSPALANVRADPHTQVVAVGPGDPLLQAFPRPHAVLAQRFASGALCLAVVVKGEFAGHVWLASGHYDEDEVRCRYLLPGTSAMWDFDVYVEPRYRGTRVMARLWKGVDQVLQARDIQWSFSRISLYNPASVQTHEQLGALHLRSAGFLTIGRLQVALFTSPLRLSLGFDPRRAPVVAMPMPSNASA